MSRSRGLLLFSTALVLTGCAGFTEHSTAERAHDDAVSSAAAVEELLQDRVAGVAPPRRLEEARRWVEQPDELDLADLGFPTVALFPEQSGASAESSSFVAVVYEYSEPKSPFDGGDWVWGRVCQRYLVDDDGRLATDEITCPAGTPENPDDLKTPTA
ncbi:MULTISPECIES: hypothetical protein [unclassified Nocardioides]|uniref:hypothetical protein n=1 Tax=unclassified Nocardioides TaxID=2615069 RepID=UPI0006F839CA|nr:MULTISPECIES: hypothetical protein [unclassified Nocardioides]KRA39149.1 hypothetical protein ASD81_11510 [Nocardioides sp. Root614]KRA93108.1 hypothetical protein ASD84_11775 [Nocardioides sp. Root682]